MQTAMKSHLQWLYDNQLDFNIPLEVIEDAEDRLEMEKQQIIDAYAQGRFDYEDYSKGIKQKIKQSKQYFAETYGSYEKDVCDYCKGKGKIFHHEFGQFVKCGVCKSTSSQTEISDEEIMKEAAKSGILSSYKAFVIGAKWYREQLKQRQ